jgi:hypothetical protein
MTMIHYTPEGAIARVGLNITCGVWRKPYVTFRWVWYDTVNRMLSSRRFRIRLYQWPVFMWGKDEGSVINSWLWEHDLDVVSREVLQDLKAMEATQKRTNEPYAIIKPL